MSAIEMTATVVARKNSRGRLVGTLGNGHVARTVIPTSSRMSAKAIVMEPVSPNGAVEDNRLAIAERNQPQTGSNRARPAAAEHTSSGLPEVLPTL